MEPPIVDRLNTRIDELRAKGRSVISLAQAVPGFPPPVAARRAAAAALGSPDVNRYTADAGLPVLREAPDFWATLQPTEPGAVKRIHEMMLRHRWEVFFITQRPATEGETVQRQT